MKIFTSSEIREIDAATIALEPVTPGGLMERAATAAFQKIKEYIAHDSSVTVFAGPGNNGGDGLVIARLLHEEQHPVRVYIVETGASHSNEFKLNADRLARSGVASFTLADISLFPAVSRNEVIIDAIFGTGLSKSPSGISA